MPARIPIDRLPDQAIHHIPLGDLDALVANLGAPTQPPALNQLLTNDGHAFFADFTATSLPSPTRPSEAIALGDVDGDGDLDAVTANPNAPNQLLINDGTGHFAPTDLTSFRGVDVALGDVNGDSNLDILFVTDGQGTQLLLNDGNGGFNSPPITLPGGAQHSRAIALGDINGDGNLDAVIANFDASTPVPNQVLINDPSGTGNFNAIPLPTLLPSNKSTDVALGDVDGDGHLDILFATDGQGTQLLLNGAGPPITLPGGSPPSRGIALGDVDGDGDLDALIANLNVPSQPPVFNQLLINDSHGHFDPTNLPGGSQPSVDIVLGDVDRDGDLDALVANLNAPNQLLINDGTGHFTSTDLPGGSQPSHAIALGDIDGDGLIPPVDDHGLPNINTLGLLPDLFV
jgi:FG-GAP-like repeat